MGKFVSADFHGRLDAMLNALAKTSFNKKKDKFIFVGDINDGGPDTKGCIDELLTFEDLTWVRGNHDDWFLRYLLGDHPGDLWLKQGGKATLRSYGYQFFMDPDTSKVPKEHVELLKNSVIWYEDEDAIYVHGGIDLGGPESTSLQDLMWDRDLINIEYKRWKYFQPALWNKKLLVVGHTCTQWLGAGNKPIILPHLIDLDTGCGHGSKATIMELPSREYWQSDLPEINILRNEDKK